MNLFRFRYIPKITILLDNGYNPKRLMAELKKLYEGIDRKIKFKLSPKPSKKEKSGKVGMDSISRNSKNKPMLKRLHSFNEDPK